MTGLLVVGHGTTDAVGVEEFGLVPCRLTGACRQMWRRAFGVCVMALSPSPRPRAPSWSATATSPPPIAALPGRG